MLARNKARNVDLHRSDCREYFKKRVTENTKLLITACVTEHIPSDVNLKL
jgi:hypothetical protein